MKKRIFAPRVFLPRRNSARVYFFFQRALKLRIYEQLSFDHFTGNFCSQKLETKGAVRRRFR